VRYSAAVGEHKAKHMAVARADLESLLRARRLDRTLTTTLPGVDPAGSGGPGRKDEAVIAPTGVAALDSRLGGGFPRGHLSELVGSRSSGRTSVMLRVLAAATARGELVALVDALDMLDVTSAAAAGVELNRLLWVRGHVVSNPGLCRDLNRRALEQAIRAFTLVLQAGNFGVVVFDVAEAPADAVRGLPFTTWMRLQRLLEGSQTAGVLVGGTPMARSSSGLTLKLGTCRAAGTRGVRFRARLFDGLDIEAAVVRARSHAGQDTRAVFSTRAAYGA
jgi:recombination protein RecA